MPWPRKCPKCRGKNISTTKKTFSCVCGYFIDNSMRPDVLEFKTFKRKEG